MIIKSGLAKAAVVAFFCAAGAVQVQPSAARAKSSNGRRASFKKLVVGSLLATGGHAFVPHASLVKPPGTHGGYLNAAHAVHKWGGACALSASLGDDDEHERFKGPMEGFQRALEFLRSNLASEGNIFEQPHMQELAQQMANLDELEAKHALYEQSISPEVVDDSPLVKFAREDPVDRVIDAACPSAKESFEGEDLEGQIDAPHQATDRNARHKRTTRTGLDGLDMMFDSLGVEHEQVIGTDRSHSSPGSAVDRVMEYGDDTPVPTIPITTSGVNRGVRPERRSHSGPGERFDRVLDGLSLKGKQSAALAEAEAQLEALRSKLFQQRIDRGTVDAVDLAQYRQTSAWISKLQKQPLQATSPESKQKYVVKKPSPMQAPPTKPMKRVHTPGTRKARQLDPWHVRKLGTKENDHGTHQVPKNGFPVVDESLEVLEEERRKLQGKISHAEAERDALRSKLSQQIVDHGTTTASDYAQYTQQKALISNHKKEVANVKALLRVQRKADTKEQADEDSAAGNDSSIRDFFLGAIRKYA